MFGREKVAALVAEALGAGALTFLVLTVQRSSIGVPFFVAAAAGLTVLLMTFALGGVSKAHFNPALTLGFWTVRKIESLTAVMYIVFQLLGAWGAYWLYTYFVNNTLQPVGGKYSLHILVAEAVGTALFAFGVASAVYQGFSRAVTASFVGLSLMLGVLAASSASIGLLNPAVALGVKAWVWGTYVAGPIIGAIVGINLYAYLFAGEKVSLPSVPAVATASPSRKKTAKKTSRKK